jgi:hypothetical protein
MKQTADRIISSFMAVLSISCFTESYRLWNGWDGPGTLPLMVGCIFLFLTVCLLVFPSGDGTENLLPGGKTVEHMGITVRSVRFVSCFHKVAWISVGHLVSAGNSC